MMNLGTIPRRLIECGGAVEELGGLWHIARTAAVTYCGDECGDWPRVAHAVERCGIWCGPCLMEASAASARDSPPFGECANQIRKPRSAGG